tara:strand:- start:51058 stop:51408 length:351 start_codon:yes stop_codon:yes gene_type:complete
MNLDTRIIRLINNSLKVLKQQDLFLNQLKESLLHGSNVPNTYIFKKEKEKQRGIIIEQMRFVITLKEILQTLSPSHEVLFLSKNIDKIQLEIKNNIHSIMLLETDYFIIQSDIFYA